MNRRYLISGILVLILLFLGSLFFSGHNYRRDLEAYKRDLLARGEKLDLLELARTLETNDTAAARRFTNYMAHFTSPTNLPLMMRLTEPGRALVNHRLISDAQMLGYDTNRSNVAALREIVGLNPLNFHLDYSRIIAIPLPHVSYLIATERLAAGAAMQALHAGDFDEAYQDVLFAINLIRLYPGDRLPVSDIVHFSMTLTASQATWELLQEPRWTGGQLAALQAAWEKVALTEHMFKSQEMERAIYVALFDYLRNDLDGPNARTYLNNVGAAPSGPTFGNRGLIEHLTDGLQEWWKTHPGYARWKKTWSYEEELQMLKEMDVFEQLLQRERQSDSFFSAVSQFQPLLATLASNANVANHLIFTNRTAIPFTNYLFRVAGAEAARRVTFTAVALERYHLAHGAYPEKLDQLVPDYLGKIPNDHLDGQPLRYARRPDGTFLLYSIGTDGIDNGGDASGGMPTWSTGVDIVWPAVIQTNSDH